ncbi:MAG: glycosyltransferase family 4 protein [Methylacidiphilales bacterium]|nr:glycosyltransferase family 4 protein [Candidatus Methylacidiphilales bacterium]
MRVLLLNQVFYPDPQSTGQHLSGLAEGLVRQGHEVTVVTSRRSYDDAWQMYPRWEMWQGIEIIRVWNTGLGHQAKWRRAVDFLSFLLAATFRAFFLSRADVVVTLTTPPLLSVLGAALAKWWKARFVYWVMDLNPDEAVAVGWLKPDGGMAHLLEAASRWSLKAASRIFVLDGYMRERLEAKGVPADTITVMPVWTQREVAFDQAGRDRFRREIGVEDKYVVMYSGNHSPCHPLETLVGAARLLRDDSRIHFCFIGGGIEWGRLKNQAETERWPNATFLGYQPLEELSGSLSGADAQVVVMGDPFVGIVHPCKIYNFLAVQRPLIYIGPERSHVTDLIREAGLEKVSASFRHGESHRLAEVLQEWAGGPPESWPAGPRSERWSEAVILEKMIPLLLN